MECPRLELSLVVVVDYVERFYVDLEVVLPDDPARAINRL